MNGVLVRVGIDCTDGRWNAPVRMDSREFAYVTITETKPLRSRMARFYDEFASITTVFGHPLPSALLGSPTHLDPDFEHLTYGDQGQRAEQLKRLGCGDLLVFFAALQAVDRPPRPLVYAIIGIYVIDQIVRASSVPRQRWAENAHTRRVPGSNDILIRAKPKLSGRLRRCIPIGELRDGAYRVRNDLLNKWGGLEVEDGFIQRSARLPSFKDTNKFYRWFLKQNEELIVENNPNARTFIVMLRQPRNHDPRTDPFWEFGSFGCTSCHRGNLLHPKNSQVRDNDRLAFVQGGSLGLRLVFITPPITRIDHARGLEIRWDSSFKPFRYNCAPPLFETNSPKMRTLFPKLGLLLASTARPTVASRFASRFRSRAAPLEDSIAAEMAHGFKAASKKAKESDFISGYADALPWCPQPLSASERKREYNRLLRQLKKPQPQPPVGCASC